jgi:putative transposase
MALSLFLRRSATKARKVLLRGGFRASVGSVTVRRRDLPDGYFHVTARGVDGAAIFLVDLDRLDFIDLLARASRRHKLRVVARSLMDTHYHLLVHAKSPDLSAAMHLTNGAYAWRFNKRHDRRGHVFAERFRSWVIRDEEHLRAAIAYIADNPTKAGPRAEPNARWTAVDLDQVRS